jgi:hypothetical protein
MDEGVAQIIIYVKTILGQMQLERINKPYPYLEFNTSSFASVTCSTFTSPSQRTLDCNISMSSSLRLSNEIL